MPFASITGLDVVTNQSVGPRSKKRTISHPHLVDAVLSSMDDSKKTGQPPDSDPGPIPAVLASDPHALPDVFAGPQTDGAEVDKTPGALRSSQVSQIASVSSGHSVLHNR
jgi:hypothetical protein